MVHLTEVREYLATEGYSPYARWFDRLNVAATVNVATAIRRMEQGNLCNMKGVGRRLNHKRALQRL